MKSTRIRKGFALEFFSYMLVLRNVFSVLRLKVYLLSQRQLFVTR